MTTDREKLSHYFDEHPGIIFNRQQVAKELGLKPGAVSSAVSNYFSHRIGINEEDKGKILPNDGFADPTGATQSKQPNRLPFVKTAHHPTRNSRKPSLDEIEKDRGSY